MVSFAPLKSISFFPIRLCLIRSFSTGIGVFCPVFRLHGFRLPYPVRDILNPDGYCGSGGPNEVWSFGETAYHIITKYMFLREKMIPYIMEQMEYASQTGTPVIRPLFFDFTEDPNLYEIGDEYMFGPDLLVAPVVERGCEKRMVYLPEGATWTDAWTKKTYQGGETAEVDTPLGKIPVFYKNGKDLQLFDHWEE